jgi:hypothetical protein
MLDIPSILNVLRENGYTPGYQTEFLDGRRQLRELGDGYVLAAAGDLSICQAGSISPVAPEGAARTAIGRESAPTGEREAVDLAAVLKEAEKAVLLTRYGEAERKLDMARALLPCLTEPVSRELLYRVFFLRGIAAYFDEQPREAERGFALAQAIAPDQAWDRSYPPNAWEIFLKAREAMVRKAPLAFRRNLSTPGAEVWVDGVPLGPDDILPLATGEHLVQLHVSATGGGAPVYRAWLLQGEAETGGGTQWITDVDAIGRGQQQLSEGSDALDRAMVLDLLLRYARKTQRAWMLLVVPDAKDPSARVQFVDVARGAISAAPAWLLRSSRPPEEVTLPLPGVPGGKKVAVPQALYGWHVAAGLVGMPEIRAKGDSVMSKPVGLEIGGFRRIQGRLDARVAIALGPIFSPNPQLSSPRFMAAVHVGIRKSWEIDPFGVFVEGGFAGCRCRSRATPGLEVRGGTYYKLDDTGRDAVELYLGLAFLPFDAGAVFGQAGANYQRAF